MKHVRTEIDIDASEHRVWEILTDLAAYPKWNPLIRQARGELKEGERLELSIQPPGLMSRTVRVIPVLVDGAAIPDRSDLPPDLAALPDHHALTLDNATWQVGLDRLIRSLTPPRAPRSTPSSTPSPLAGARIRRWRRSSAPSP